MPEDLVAGSFRDPSGYVFVRDNTVYRRVRNSYREHYDQLIDSGLYASLTTQGLLVRHEAVAPGGDAPADTYLDLLPEQIPFVSYPYEWSFGQLRDAALLTLQIQREALTHGMSLKDASAYNVQFLHGRPVFIDTLSFEPYREGRPWVAYQQFCEHFLAPLALMSLQDIRLNQLLRVHIDGIPAGLASKLLPKRTYLRFGVLMHIHLLAAAQARYADNEDKAPRIRALRKKALSNILYSLEKTVLGLTWKPENTEWSDYYDDNNNYESQALADKERFVKECIASVSPLTVWDLGANTGRFSRLASGQGSMTMAFDIDPACIEINYRRARDSGDKYLLPLYLDLTNPSPDIGWDNAERLSLKGRPKPDLVLALALVHHLAISNNLPLDRIAAYLSGLAPNLVIEFVPKGDSMVQRLLQTREDIFPDYTVQGFEEAFGRYYTIVLNEQTAGSERSLYLMQRRQDNG